MSDFAEFYRFRKQVFDTHTCAAVEVWFDMAEEIKERLRKQWAEEDAEVKEEEKDYTG